MYKVVILPRATSKKIYFLPSTCQWRHDWMGWVDVAISPLIMRLVI